MAYLNDGDARNPVPSNTILEQPDTAYGFTFIFHQQVALATWTITHNLHKFPSVTVVDSTGSLVYGDVRYVDENNLIVAFSAGFAGSAYLN